jgi:hypothetical protein
MFELKWTAEANRQLSEIERNAGEEQAPVGGKPSQQMGLLRQVRKTLALLQINPKHGGLNCHLYSGYANPYDKTKHVWEAYVQNKTPGAYRVFWCYGPTRGWITIIAITPHP